jgi:rhodanese-related sulfurtransferase
MVAQTNALPSIPYENISVRDAHARPDLIKIDVRQPDELASDLGYVDGVHNYPLNELLENGLPAGLPKDAPILMICRSGGRSGKASAFLTQRGYTSVHNMDGGMLAWNEAGLPRHTEVVKSKKESTLGLGWLYANR